ncbi:MAG: choice-of-anchor Q domain-containing protein, partial [Flavobacteriales bacterium]
MKKLFLTTLMAVTTAFGYSQTPYWSYAFDNGAMTDAMGNDDLTQNGSALTTVADRFANANDAVTLNGDYLVGGTTGAGSYSVSVWLKDVANSPDERLFAHQFLNNYGYSLRTQNGLVKATCRFGTSVNNNPYSGSSSAFLVGPDVTDGNWHHVVLTAREFITNGFEYKFEYKLYVDGVQVDSDVRTVSMISGANRQHEGLASGSTLVVGTTLSDNVSHYENTIDDIAFYKEDLTAAEVLAIFSDRPAVTIYVDEDATGANDGSSWADAFVSLKDATDYATVVGDEIWVADGTYLPDPSSRTASFNLGTGISLYGGFNGTETALSQRDWRTNETVLSGDLLGNDNANLDYNEATRNDNTYRIVVLSGDNTLIDGVTISGGHGNNTSDNNYNRGSAIRKFGAINTVDVRNCIIENNVANIIAGIMCEYTSSSAHTTNLENCTFRNNVSRYGSAYMVSHLAGTGTATVANCLMADNQATNLSPGVGFSGSAGFLDSRAGSSLNASVINCTVVDNVDNGTGTGNEPAPVAVRRHGGTLDLAIVNCAFDGNSASKSIGRLNSGNCPTTAVLSNNRRPDTNVSFCTATSTNESSVGLNLNAAYRPVAGSSSIDAGDNSYAVGTEDVDGNNRIMNSTIDIGAFEYDPSACSPITQQPVAVGFCAGDNVTLSVGTTGTITSYQWKKGGANVTGATSATLTLTNAQSGDAGDYTVEVVATCGTVTSSAATLSLNASTPTITTQPSDASGCESDDVGIAVGADGSGLTYQWYQDGNAVSGANSSSLFFDGIDAAEAGDYTVIVDGAGVCPITSDVAVVTVNPIPSYSQQPTNQLGCLGGDVTFTANANGATLVQWYKDGNPMAGELSSTLTLSGLVAGDIATYKMIASNSCGALFSDDVQLNIGSSTTITSQPQGASQCENTNVTFSASVTGTNISYQWQLDGQDLSGATFPNLIVNGLTQSDEGDYTCVVTGTCGVETTNIATLVVKDPAAITTTVSDFTECEGEDVTFSVSATGDGLSYAWIDQTGYIAGETGSSLSLTDVQASDAGSYTVEVAGTCGAPVADAGDLTVNAIPVPVITENLGMLETGVFDTYQWYIDGNIQNGETGSSITITVSGDYTVEVTENGCEGSSAPYNVMTVGIEEQSASIVAAYPNPFTNMVTVELDGFAGQTEITVVDMTGRVVFT